MNVTAHPIRYPPIDVPKRPTTLMTSLFNQPLFISDVGRRHRITIFVAPQTFKLLPAKRCAGKPVTVTPPHRSRDSRCTKMVPRVNRPGCLLSHYLLCLAVVGLLGSNKTTCVQTSSSFQRSDMRSDINTFNLR